MAVNSRSCDRICSDCRTLSIDILSGSTRSNDRWQTISSLYATLSYAKSHLDGAIERLEKSARYGCVLCSLIINKVRNLNEALSTASYYIFVWERSSQKCQFQIVIGDINVFTKPVSDWQPPQSIVFYGRQVLQMTLLPQLGNSSWQSKGEMPSLSYLPLQNLGSSEAIQRTTKWLLECQNYHAECSRPLHPLPKRVVDLGKPSEGLKIALYITNGELQPYAALSYQWGITDRLVTTKTKEKKSLKVRDLQFPGDYAIERRNRGEKSGKTGTKFECVYTWNPIDIPLIAFPETHRDALQIAKGLGFQYIWIDSLCILQGDTEDWVDQGAAMTDIYGGSTLVISATSSENSRHGILNELRNDKIGIGTWERDSPGKKSVEILVGDPREILDLEEKSISQRGWVFQERLVSTATLHYTDDGMVWECAHGTSVGHDQDVTGYIWKTEWQKFMRQSSLNLLNAGYLTGSPKYHNTVWYQWISAYSERTLFDVRDKFPAIAGVAKRFSEQLKLTYKAGLWGEDFIAGLLWRRHSRTETLVRDGLVDIAPSWSWGSVTGRLEYCDAKLIDSPLKGTNLEVSEINISEVYPGKFGPLKPGGTVTVEGLVQAVTLDLQKHPGIRQRAHQECGVSKGFVNNENVLCMMDEFNPKAPREYNCWCLRIGSHDSYGREADIFLLLDRVAQTTNEFRRVGLAWTDAWYDRMLPTPDSGLFESASPHMPQKLTIR